MEISGFANVIYLIMTSLIIFWVGWLFYRNGRYYLEEIFPDNNVIAHSLNRMLLVGYYLLNIGYVVLSWTLWPRVTTWLEMVEALSTRVGLIMVILGCIHFINLWWVRKVRRYLQRA